MVKVYLSINPKTQRALYEDQHEFLGTFSSVQHAAHALGDLFRFCKVITAH